MLHACRQRFERADVTHLFEELVEGVDIALVDGTFYSGEELGVRSSAIVSPTPAQQTADMSADGGSSCSVVGQRDNKGSVTIPHPFIADTMQMLSKGDTDRHCTDVRFLHLNHSNAARRHAVAEGVRASGFGICKRGDVIWL